MLWGIVVGKYKEVRVCIRGIIVIVIDIEGLGIFLELFFKIYGRFYVVWIVEGIVNNFYF